MTGTASALMCVCTGARVLEDGYLGFINRARVELPVEFA